MTKEQQVQEPTTPTWFTILGVGLLVTGLIATAAVISLGRQVPICDSESLRDQTLEPTPGVIEELQKNVNNE